MEVIHLLKGRRVKGKGSSCFFLSSMQGGYLAMDHVPYTQYEGWFHFLNDEWELYKSLEDIRLDSTPERMVNYGNWVERKHAKASEKFFLVGNASLLYTVEGYKGHIHVDVDFRRIHDYDDKGRIYDVYEKDGVVVVTYRKFTDDTLREMTESLHMAIKTTARHSIQNEWYERRYPYDDSRNIRSVFYVRKLLKLSCDGDAQLSFGVSADLNEAISLCNESFNSSDAIRKQFMGIKAANPKMESSEIYAFNNLVMDIKNSSVGERGIFAGLPWFYQFWSRDELVSLVGLLLQKKFVLAKSILLRHIGRVNAQGMVPNRWPDAHLTSADATGWLYKRLMDFLTMLESDAMLGHYVTEKELAMLYERVRFSIQKIENNRTRQELIYNNALETWMDTHDESGLDKRDGVRIEIQALHLAMLKCASLLARMLAQDSSEFDRKQKDLAMAVRRTMFRDGALFDGIDSNNVLDMTVRPNVFLAYYTYPEMFSREEWKSAFDRVIAECWLEWGGFSSISKNSPLFQPMHTGINNRSYHRGDSWYFINNIAAICMHDVDKSYYAEKIDKIRKASLNDMMFLGFVGQCSELSSASTQTASGCLSQAWSAATLMELLSKTED